MYFLFQTRFVNLQRYHFIFKCKHNGEIQCRRCDQLVFLKIESDYHLFASAGLASDFDQKNGS
jgi:hypothetical protein